MSKRLKIIALTLLLVVSSVLSLSPGCALKEKEATTPNLELIEEAWNIIHQDYVDTGKLDQEKLIQGAVRGMVEAIDDPYTSYLDRDTYELWMQNLEGKFEGIGAWVEEKDNKITIVAPVPGSPAERAGIRAGDVIVEIDGRSTEGMSLIEAVLTIRGPKGTTVTLGVLHQGETEPVVINITREEIKLPSVSFEMKDSFAYIWVTHFSETTVEELAPAIKEANKEARGIILDLRNNGGGLLNSVIDVAGFFLRRGVVLEMVDNQGRHTSYQVEPSKITTELPMVVLVNSYSASGSEVLAGALQDYRRATIAGTKTFGKGSVTVVRQLKDGSALNITTARWLTPNGRLIEGEGLEPDYTLGEDEDAIQWAIDFLKSH